MLKDKNLKIKQLWGLQYSTMYTNNIFSNVY